MKGWGTMENTVLNRYKKAVQTFTDVHYSMLQALRAISKDSDSDQDIKILTKNYLQAKKELLDAKETAGFDDGLSFLKDLCNFKGFRIEDGEVKGDVHYAADIIRPWIINFPYTTNNYQYEVALLILSQLN